MNKPHIVKRHHMWECSNGISKGLGVSPKSALYHYCLSIELYPMFIVGDADKVIDCWYKRGKRRA